MSLVSVLERFSSESKLKNIVQRLMDDQLHVREAAYDELTEIYNLVLNEEEALAVLNAATILDFPELDGSWKDPADKLIQQLWPNAHKSLIEPGREAYPDAADGAKRGLLALFGSVKCCSRESAEALASCVSNHGWPVGDMYERFFWGLDNLIEYAEVLYPTLLIHAEQNLNGITVCLLNAIYKEKIDRTTLAPANPVVSERLKLELENVVEALAINQRDRLHDEEHSALRSRLVCLLDVAGWIPDFSGTSELEKTLTLEDEVLLCYAATSSLRLGLPVEDSILEKVAACDEIRVGLFTNLNLMNELQLYPEKWRTWASFAAADMAQNIIEQVGLRPDKIELMAIFKGTQDDEKMSVYVWRYKCEATMSGRWLGACCGPYVLEGDPVPIQAEEAYPGEMPWEYFPPEVHAETILEEMDDWHLEWSSDENL